MAEERKKVIKRKKSRMGWSEASEASLLNMWPSRVDELRGHRKNGHVYAEMADELQQQGYSCSPRYVQVKLQNFTQRYRKEKAAVGISGGSPSTWTHFRTVHQIIGGFKANYFADLVLESVDESNSSPSTPPAVPLSAPSPPLSACSPSPGPSSTSASEPQKKKTILI